MGVSEPFVRVAAIVVAACSVTAPVRRVTRSADGRPIAVAGEAMEYRVSLRGLLIGHVQVAVGEPGIVGGRPAIVVRARGTTDGLVALVADVTWEQTTTLDVERGTVIDSVSEAWATVPGGHQEHARDERHDGYDVLAAAAALRGLVGQASLELDLPGDARVEIDVREDGPDHVPGTGVPAVRLAGTISFKHRPFSVWLSDDAARVPLRVTAPTPWGEAEARLEDYHAPAT